MAINYFTIWVEVASFVVLNYKKVAQFIRRNIICPCGLPCEIISNNGSHFQKEVSKLLQEFKVVHHHYLPYDPQTNGAVKVATKNVKLIFQKTMDTYKNWPDRLPDALWGYQTSVRISTRAILYSLVIQLVISRLNPLNF